MKKFWNLMLAVLVMLGAAACAENVDSVDVKGGEGLSFYADFVGNETRTDLQYDENAQLWKSVWEGNETIWVRGADFISYLFTNSVEDPNKFTCKTEGVEGLVGNAVVITMNDVDQSKVGKDGVSIYHTISNFDPKSHIEFEADNAFLRYKYEGEGSVTLTITSDADPEQKYFYYGGESYSSITFEGAEQDKWVSILASYNSSTVTLSYSIDGVECAETRFDMVRGMVYNLGTLSKPAEPEYDSHIYLVPSEDWMTDNAWFAAYFFNSESGFNQPVTMTETDGIYECGVPADVDKVIFCRMSPDFTEFGWNTGEEGENDPKHVWNQTANLEIGVEPNNYYHIIGWDNGAWGTKDHYEIPVVPTSDYKLYLYNCNTSWSTVNLYMWDVASGEYMSAWPGAVYDSTTTINGYDYLVWNITKNMEGKSVSIILNDGTQQTGDYALGLFDKDYYIKLNGSNFTIIADPSNPEAGSGVDPTPDNPGEQSLWSIFGDFEGTGSWIDVYMTTIADANIVVAKNIEFDAAQGFLVRKPSTEWSDKYAAGDINYLKANHYITTVKDGNDLCVEAAGIYDIYFNTDTKVIYVMTAGADYTTATEQTVNGEEPKQEEPEVTEKVVYLKPNNNWKEANARFAAYFWNNSGNVWVSMTACGDGTYEVHLPEGYDYGCNVIFCRMNPGTTANNWNNKWNQTSDLTTPTDGKNLYTVTEGTWDKGGGTWSVK